MFSQTFKNIDNLEQERAMRAEFESQVYTFIIDNPYQWSQRAAPKKDGLFDHDTALTELKQSILQKAFTGELITLPERTLEEAIV